MMGIYVQVGRYARAGRLAPGYVIQENGCWEWIGAKGPSGYGIGWNGSRQAPAHRVVYERMVGPIPDGLELDHLCRNRLCVNPAHLEPVTGHENILRGYGWAGRNARKTHCPQGHPYAADNLYLRPGGNRSCRICDRAKRTRYDHAVRARLIAANDVAGLAEQSRKWREWKRKQRARARTESENTHD